MMTTIGSVVARIAASASRYTLPASWCTGPPLRERPAIQNVASASTPMMAWVLRMIS